MEESEYHNMAEQEEKYWWHKGRRKIITTVADTFFPHHKNSVADIGCGTGGNFEILSKYGTVDGLDMSESALEYCRNRNVYNNVVCTEADSVPKNTYSIITAFDVLEHLDNDIHVLRRWKNSLKPNGYVFITVPAYTWLFGPHDISLHHKRRYTCTELLKKVREAGFIPVFSSYFFLFTFPMLCVSRIIQKTQKNAQIISTYPKIPNFFSKILESLSTLEAFFIKHTIPLPFGSSIILIARKK